ncbi:lipoyl protein ligase domain-containing protein [Ramlibacter alkalitolerans]|uniref:Lipoate--protein ligase n=1 Tax=Ramlibacter alkalitolerans TaxID=2039631 RepID=A0ABS1JL06_9BURK|nr:lipoate--protein ligase [Ramlibacter alkalitolerans]MBL0424915.1 lipoate--protein ligase [Ramlibacter alkalitolerans]
MRLPAFESVTVHEQPLAGGVACESAWMERCATTGRAEAHLWQAPVGLVVPRRYTLLPGWQAARDAATGEVQVRSSGGGLVPQGPGMWNLSLIWPAPGASPVDTTAVYLALCAELAAAFAQLGITATAQPVTGSFCDGRFNLAVDGRKLVGTAQAWRRVAGRPLVLAHAVIVVDADPARLTAQANDFEAALGSDTRYRADALTSVAIEAADAEVARRALQAIAGRFAHVLTPRG